MNCRIADLKNKQIVCIKDGAVLGYIYDVELDTETGSLVSLIVPGRARFLGFFGREEDVVIPWSKIEVIGQETVLVDFECPQYKRKPKRGLFEF